MLVALPVFKYSHQQRFNVLLNQINGLCKFQFIRRRGAQGLKEKSCVCAFCLFYCL